MAGSLWSVEGGVLRLSFHPGQTRAWEARQRFVFVIAGTQSGKTSWGPWWLWREIRETASEGGGDNDYIAATSSYDLFKLKMLPEIKQVFEGTLGIGRYWSGDRVMELRDPRDGRFWAKKADDPMWGRIILRSAGSGGGLESNTARAAWLDECGQPAFTEEVFEAIRRRLSLHRGRILGSTTPYDLGTLKRKFYDPWKAGDPDIAVINFDSTENPAFPREEFEDARRSMPEWRFNLFYRGLFTRPAGQIYDSFQDTYAEQGGHKLRPRPIPAEWFRYAGVDFGVVNACVGLWAAEERDGELTGRYILYRTYKEGGKATPGHVEAVLKGEPVAPLAVGGARSEDEWRHQWTMAGLPVARPAVADLEVGIDLVYGAHAQGRILVFDDQEEYLRQKREYTRELDEQGEPTTRIRDKERYHALDQERYAASYLFPARRFFDFSLKRHTCAEAPEGLGSHFAGLFYGEGKPCAFVLCATDAAGGVTALDSFYGGGISPEKQAERIAAILRRRGIAPRAGIALVASAEVFERRTRGAVTGRSIADDFRAAGIYCVPGAGSALQGFTRVREYLAGDRLRIVRPACPELCAALPIVGYDRADPDAPNLDGPVAPVRALALALMTRPEPTRPPGAGDEKANWPSWAKRPGGRKL